MSYKTCIGLDPGMAGGISYFADGAIIAEKMPETDTDLLDLLKDIFQASDGSCFALLERVSSSPQMGVVSAFTFGKGYGALQMALTATGIPFDFVAPAVWQRAMGCLSKGDKGVTKAAAQRLFPHMKCTHAVSDSMLIAEYCRRTRS